MKIKIKKLDERAVIPTYAKEGDVGLDLTATWVKDNGTYVEYGTGLSIEIPEGYFGLCRPRSSISKTDLLFNTSGIIDSGYRGELTIRFKIEREYVLKKTLHFSSFEVLQLSYNRPQHNIPKVGERIAQLIILPYPHIDLIEVDELTETERGTGGYGSTGS